MFTFDIKELPFVSMTGRSREGSVWSHSGRSMGVNQLTVIKRGECVFRINETDYPLKAGDVIIVPKGTYYKPHTDTFCEYTFFRFDGELYECEDTEIRDAVGGSDSASFYGYSEDRTAPLLLDYKLSMNERAKDIELLLGKCVNTKGSHTGMRQILLSLYFTEILVLLSETLSKSLPQSTEHPQSLSKILYYIKENYTANIQLDDIAEHTKMSKQYCMRLFKKYMNTTINDYILELRMKHAAYLLRDTYMNVNQTADYLGFSSVSYFSRAFKKYFGVSPSEYSE
jgi:AraC-like DNA-binding protein